MDIEQYIRQAALARGINPDIAVRVARSEGGLHDPFRHGEGPAPRSQDPRYGRLENSFGPFQLYVSGRGAGLGDRAVAAGIDPQKNWQGGIDYALNEAAQKGWSQWYGAAKAGVGNYAGIRGARPGAVTASSPAMTAPTSALAGMMAPGPTAAPQMFGDLIGQNQVATSAVGPMDFGTVAANLLNSAQERDRAKAETEAAETARRVALFGGADGSGLWGLYA